MPPMTMTMTAPRTTTGTLAEDPSGVLEALDDRCRQLLGRSLTDSYDLLVSGAADNADPAVAEVARLLSAHV